MNFKKVFQQLNIPAQCRKYGLPLWQCPPFLFLIMGIIIIGSTVGSYTIGTRYIEDPTAVALIAISLTMVLFTVATVITQSFERLAEANRMKSEFVSIVSHQLRSPLANLSWAIELLMSGRVGKVEGKQIEYFKILKENSNRMKELISDLLMVSRIEQGKLPLSKIEFSFQDLIKEVILGLEHVAEAFNVEIKFASKENLPKAFADSSQVKLVIENLLDNAIRYMKGGGEVEMTLEGKEKCLILKIKDSGVGIPKKDRKHIFQKFFRSENVLRHQTQGSGLGLYIAKSIVEKSGGKIGFKSEENMGSTFWFTLPIKKS